MTTVAAPSDAPGLESRNGHALHVYDNESVFLDTLEGFVAGGLRRGEVVIVVATSAHLYSLEYRLGTSPVDITGACGRRQLHLRRSGHHACKPDGGWPP